MQGIEKKEILLPVPEINDPGINETGNLTLSRQVDACHPVNIYLPSFR